MDKTLLIADVLDGAGKVTLFCRPRRFGKSLNMTMLRAFFELPPVGQPGCEALFDSTEVWEAGGGRYRAHQGAYPVIYLSFNTVKRLTWEQSYEAIKALVRSEVSRHEYLLQSDKLDAEDRDFLARYRAGCASPTRRSRSSSATRSCSASARSLAAPTASATSTAPSCWATRAP